MKVDLNTLDTEEINGNSNNIDEVSMLEKVTIINNEDKKIAYAVEKQLTQIAEFAEHVAESYKE